MRKINWASILAGGIFFLLPFLCNPYNPNPELQLEPPKLIGVFLLGSFLFANYLRILIHWSLGALFLVFSFNCFWSGFGSMQMYGFAYLVTALVISLWYVEQSEKTKKMILHSVLAAGILSSFMALLQMHDSDPIFRYAPGVDNTHPIAFFGQTTKFGAFLVMAFAISMAYDYVLVSCFLGLVAISTNSSMVFAALGAVILVRSRRWNYGVFISHLILTSGLVALGLFFLISPHNIIWADSGRFEIWGATINAWREYHPFWGFGPGAFSVIFPDSFQPISTAGHGIFTRAHNDYIQAIFDFGVPGILVMLSLFYTLGRYFKLFLLNPQFGASPSRIAAECMLAAILTNALANFPWQLSPHFLLGFLSLSVLLKAVKDYGTIGLD